MTVIKGLIALNIPIHNGYANTLDFRLPQLWHCSISYLLIYFWSLLGLLLFQVGAEIEKNLCSRLEM